MTARDAFRLTVSGLFTAVGIAHFTHTKTLERIVPDYLPAHREIVLISGVAELAGAAGLAFGSDEVRRWSGLWLIATLVAVFPANLNMALHPDQYPEIWGGRTTLILRLPVQMLFIWLVWLAMRSARRPAHSAA